MAAIRDSGFKLAPAGNVAVDFVWGNMPGQTNDDRSGSSISFNATGGTVGFAATAGNLDAVVTAASASAGTVTYTAANEYVSGQIVSVTGLNGSVAITAISGSGTVVTYSTASTVGLNPGQTITVTGSTTPAYNLVNAVILAVNAGVSFTVTNVATGATSTATGTYSSAFNLTGTVLAAGLSATSFGVTNAATDRAVSGATGVAVVPVGAIPGLGADRGWSTTTDFKSTLLVATQPVVAVGLVNYNVPLAQRPIILGNYDAFPANAQPAYKPAVNSGGYNPASTLVASVLGASGNATTVTYTTRGGNFTAGQAVTVTGLYNYVAAGSTQPIATQYYAPTVTTLSAYNLTAVTIAAILTTNGVQTGFTVTNGAVDATAATLTGGPSGTATVTIAAAATTATVPTVVGLSYLEANRVLGNAQFNPGVVTFTSAGVTIPLGGGTPANQGIVSVQSLTGTQTLGATVNLTVTQVPTNETESAGATQATEFTVNV